MNIGETMTRIVISILCICHLGFSGEPDRQKTPYVSSWTIDGLAFGGGVLAAFSASAIDEELPIPALSEINALKRGDVNFFDRIAAGNYSKTQMTLSDAAMIASFGSPLLLLIDERVREDWGTITAMYLEMALYSNFFPSYGKGSVKRFRPFVYGSSASIGEKQDIEALRSFFSGHATRAFAAGVMTAIMFEDYFPDSEFRTHVWIASVGMAATCAALRVTSGAHFPTDVITGAVVGSAIGWFIPYIHRSSTELVTVNPIVSPDGSGISMSVRF